MRVVITGGAGFIGANLCRSLMQGPASQVVVVDDLSTGFRTNLDGLDVDFREATVLDAPALDDAFANADAVVHLAAVASVPRSIDDPMATNQANVQGTLEVLQAARRAGVGYVLTASSSSVYGANPEIPKRESMRANPISPYAVSKLAAEMYSLAFARSYGLKVLAVRFFNVYGPHQSAGHVYAAVTPNFIQAALAGQALTVFGDGEQTRDFTYVGSLCAVLADAVSRRVTSVEPVNGAFGTRTSLNQFIATLQSIVGSELQISYTDPRKGDVRDSQADTGELRRLFPDFQPAALDEGLTETVGWYRKHLTAVLNDQPLGN